MHTTEQLNTALAGRYAIEKQIGAGGMATVYLARDVKHNRQVALKVLNPELGAVLGAERFMAEIEVTANLHHPNLLPLFDSGEAGGLLFYVMPYVEGETLRARLVRERQLGVDEAVRIAIAIANALDYAHRHNVIHRDLKPENILMHEGQPLVMDFGIALAVSKAGGARITQTGLSLGTPQYMSPEQATGDHALDARTDIYSLGAVLYEMLVGDPPHTGSTVQAVIAKVITEHPSSVRATRPNVPEHVEAALLMALAKVPADRFASAADFAAALGGQRPVTMPTAMRGATSGTASPTGRRGARLRESVAWLVAAAAIGVAAWPRERPSAPTMGRFDVSLPESLSLAASNRGSRLAISRDGASLAFVVGRGAGESGSLFVRSATDGSVRRVSGTDSAYSPTFSPDGRWLLFTVAFKALAKVPVGGGTPVIVTRVPDSASLTSASWGDGDRIVFNKGNQLWITTADGAEPQLLATPDTATGTRGFFQPHILPGGTHALVVVLAGRGLTRVAALDSSRLAVVSLDDGKVAELGIRGFAPQFAASGHLVFARVGGVINVVPFSLKRRVVTGAPTRLLDGVSLTGTAGMDVGVSLNGWMAYATGASNPPTTLVAVDLAGKERPLLTEPRLYADPAISPDGRRVVLRLLGSGFDGGDLWMYELASGAFTALTRDGVSYRPAWSRDGARVLHLNGRSPATRIVSRPWDGSGAESVLVARPALAEIAPGPSRGLSAIRTLTGPRDIYLAPTESLSAMRPFVMGPANEVNPRISPNGRWLAYASDETGREEVYLRPIPGPGARVPVSVTGGTQPRWSSDGRTLYYRGGGAVRAATIVEQGGLAVSRRDSLFADRFVFGDRQSWDVFPNGREFLFAKGPPTPQGKLYLLVNWQQMLGNAGGTEAAP